MSHQLENQPNLIPPAPKREGALKNAFHVIGHELRQAKNPRDVFRVFHEILQGVQLGVAETREEIRKDFKRIDAESDFRLHKNMLRIDLEVTRKHILQNSESAFSDNEEIRDYVEQSLIEDFGRHFFENSLTQQFCDAVVVEDRIVMMGTDGEVKVLDVSEIDSEKAKNEVKADKEARERIKQLLDEADRSVNPEEQRGWIELKNAWYFHQRPLRLDSEILTKPWSYSPWIDEMSIHSRNENGSSHNFRGDTQEKLREITGKEGILRAEINRPFELKMGEMPASDPATLRVYGFPALRQELQKQVN